MCDYQVQKTGKAGAVRNSTVAKEREEKKDAVALLFGVILKFLIFSCQLVIQESDLAV